MKRHLGIGAAWLGATVLSVVISSAAVAGIRDRVVETPVAIGAPTSTTTSMVVGTTSTEVPLTSVSVPSATTNAAATTAPPAETTSTTAGAATEPTTTTSATTATTAPPATTTTTTAPPAATTTTTAPPATTTTAPISYSTHDLIGGTVVLAFGSGQVNLVSATPRPGFNVDAEHTGPDEVEIKFESNDHKSKLEAKIENGELKVETEEEPRGGEEE